MTRAEMVYGEFLERDLARLRRIYPEIEPGRIYSGIEKGFVLEYDGEHSLKFKEPVYAPASE